MSEQADKQEKSIFQKIGDFGKAYGTIITIAGGIVVYAVDFTNRIYPDKDTRDKGVQMVQNGPTPEQMAVDRVLDSVNKVNAIKSRRKRDSLMVIYAETMQEFGEDIKHIKKTQAHQDSISNLNADQIFQIKEEIKKQ